MKRLLLAVTAVILSAASCMREFSEEQPVSDKSSIQVSIEQLAATKTYLEDTQVKWASGDRLLLFDGVSSGSIYKVSDASAGSVSAQFLYEGTLGESGGYKLDHSIAFYPMDENVGCLSSGSGAYKLTGVTLPARQVYQEDSFASGAFLMVAVKDKDSEGPYSFRNVCGGLRLQFYGDCAVREIEVRGNDGELLAGNASVAAYSDGSVPVITVNSGASETVILDCGAAGIRLKKSQATDFIISLPPMVFSKGFKVTVRDVLGREMVLKTSRSNSVLRSSLLKMPAAKFEVIPSGQNVVYDLDKDNYSATYAKIDITLGAKCQTAFHYTMMMDSTNAGGNLEAARKYYEGSASSRKVLAEYLSAYGYSVTPSTPDEICDASWIEYNLKPDTEYVIAYCCKDVYGKLSEAYFSEPFRTKSLVKDRPQDNRSDVSLEFSDITRTSLKFNFSYDPSNTAVLKFICIKNGNMDLYEAYGDVDVPEVDAPQSELRDFFDKMDNSLFMNVWPRSSSGSDTYTLVGLEPGSEVAYAYVAEDMDGVLSEVKIAEAVMKEDKPGPDPEVRIDPVWDPATRTWTVTFSMVKDCSKFKYTLNCDDNMFLARLGTGDMRAYEFYNHWDSFVTAYGLETSYDSVTATSVPDEDHVALAVSWGKNAEDKDVVSGLEYIILTKDGQMMKISDYYPSYIEK